MTNQADHGGREGGARFRWGDLPEHGGQARRYRHKLDRTVCARNRQLAGVQRYSRRIVAKWRRAGNRWYAKLMKELIRQEPEQTGWTQP